MATDNLTAERLRQVLRYDPETGVFTWLLRTSNRIVVGDIAGTLAGDGRLAIGLFGNRYLAHRLAWFYMHGHWPVHDIDHRDGNPLNNRIDNLRDVVRSTNIQNMHQPHRDSKSGFLGVTLNRSKDKWEARLFVNGKKVYAGYFDTAETAHAAYLRAKEIHHPGSEITTYREAMPGEICQPGTTARSDSRSGLRGVRWNKRLGKWQGRITVNGKQVHLGLFDSKEATHHAYLEARRRFYDDRAI